MAIQNQKQSSVPSEVYLRSRRTFWPRIFQSRREVSESKRASSSASASTTTGSEASGELPSPPHSPGHIAEQDRKLEEDKSRLEDLERTVAALREERDEAQDAAKKEKEEADAGRGQKEDEKEDEKEVEKEDDGILWTCSERLCGPGASVEDETKVEDIHEDVAMTNWDGLKVRTMQEIPKPKGSGDVVVKVEASTITLRDYQMCNGNGLTRAMMPFVPGYEFVGRVHATTAKAEGWGYQKGDRVTGMSLAGGANGKYVSIPAQRLTLISESVDAAQAACLVHDYAAALEALTLAKQLTPLGQTDAEALTIYPFMGKRLLVTDGDCPVGRAVIDLGMSEGFKVYACVEPHHVQHLRDLGVRCLDKDCNRWLPLVQGKMDVVVDNSLACTDFYGSPWVALNETGGLVSLLTADDKSRHGSSWDGWARKWIEIKNGHFVDRTGFVDAETSWTQSGTFDFPRDNLTKWYRKGLHYLMQQLDLGRINPIVAKRVSLAEVPEAQKLVESGKARGTVICVP